MTTDVEPADHPRLSLTPTAGSLITVDPVTDARWAELVRTRRSDVFHSSAWCAVLRQTYGFDLQGRVLLDERDRPAAGLVIATVDDVERPRLVSLPFSDFCDPLVDHGGQWQALIDDLVAAGTPLQLRCLHQDAPLADTRFEPAGWAYWHAVDLPEDPGLVWDRIDPAARRNIRRARQAGVEVRPAEDLRHVRAFFELHLSVRKHKYGMLAQPWAFFRNIWHHLLEPGDGVLLLARHDGDVVGGVLYLRWGDTLYYKFNASDSARLTVRPNDLLVWAGIEHACAAGLGRLDFGVSDWEQEGLVRYKRKYATTEAVVHSLRHTPGGPSERETRLRAVVGRLSELLADPRVPDDITEQAGDALYRYFT